MEFTIARLLWTYLVIGVAKEGGAEARLLKSFSIKQIPGYMPTQAPDSNLLFYGIFFP